MNAKLTLSLDPAVIAKAKHYAKNTGRSVSEMVEKYFESLTELKKDGDISPELKKLYGAVKLPENFDTDRAKRDYLEEKYLSK